MSPTPAALYSEVELRAAVVREAESWLWTPYCLGSAVKGAGVDCGLLPYQIYKKFNLVPNFIPDNFADDWFAHTTKERYLLMVEKYARKTAHNRTLTLNPKPGDLAMVKVGDARVFNHSGVVTSWPYVIHAGIDHVEVANTMSDPLWLKRELVIFDFINR